MIREIKKVARQMGYEIYTEPFKLNIWGFRGNSIKANSFDDEIHVFTNMGTLHRPKWFYMVAKATTDPGTYWLKNPMRESGTAILNPGQYKNVYGIGKHRGKYKALVQMHGAVSITRDYNRDAILDFKNGRVERGQYGINIHRASKVRDEYRVEKYSAGCQVFQHITDFEFFMRLCERHRKLHGNKFTYTLLDKRMEFRQGLKQVIAKSAVVGLMILTGAYLLHLIESSHE